MAKVDTVEIEYAHHAGNHVPGDRETLEVSAAKRLVKAGVAKYATKTEAKKAGDA